MGNKREKIGQEIRTKANKVKQGCRFLPSSKHGHTKIYLVVICASVEHVKRLLKNSAQPTCQT